MPPKEVTQKIINIYSQHNSIVRLFGQDPFHAFDFGNSPLKR